jgi:glycerol-3-phosphate dehydrogenase
MRRPSAPDTVFDVAVIGAGVVGCAIFRAFVLAGARAVLLERAADIIEGASKANSAILHTGFDATPNTLEARCVSAGHGLYRSIHARLGLPLLGGGALVVAWTPADLARLPAILALARANGVTDAVALDAAELRDCEPGLAGDALGAVGIAGESLIDPWSAPLAYALQGVLNGGTIQRGAAVERGAFQAGTWTLHRAGAGAGPGEMRARVVVNCAGLQGDLIEAIARPSPFEIRPRKGQFVVFDKTAYDLVRRIILPVPTETTKGVVIARTVFGNLLVGPTAEEQADRDTAALDETVLRGLVAAGTRMVPALAAEQPITAYAGLRPATRCKDYQIEAVPERGWISVAGIRSTGLTGSLGIAEYVVELFRTHFPAAGAAWAVPDDPVWPLVANLAEFLPRPYQLPGRAEIVCHCEMVTAAEIEAALDGPLPAGTIGGLRRRTRAMNGRCQGFYCTRRVLRIVGGRIPDLARPVREAA